jgi:ABC-2 type transport system ATP-binding protein
MSNASPVIRASGLKVHFKQGRRSVINALAGVDVIVQEGEIFGILGPNGAGKSTLMYCFLGLLRPDAGELTVLGETPVPGGDIYNEIAYLPEEPHYHPYLRVEEAVLYYARLYRREITQTEVSQALIRVGLQDFKRLRIANCSKGMKQKVGIASCMLFVPKIIYLDEPTRGLDPIMTRQFRDYLLDINQRGTTIVLNSHVLSEVELICRRIAIINRGHILADGLLNDLIQTNREVYEVSVQGNPPMPPYAENVRRESGQCKAQVNRENLEQFVRYCHMETMTLLSCRLLTETLEDVFMRVLEAEPHE